MLPFNLTGRIRNRLGVGMTIVIANTDMVIDQD